MKMLKRWISVCLVILLLAGVAFDHSSLIGSTVEAAGLEETDGAEPAEESIATATYTDTETKATEEKTSESASPTEQTVTNTDTEIEEPEEQSKEPTVEEETGNLQTQPSQEPEISQDTEDITQTELPVETEVDQEETAGEENNTQDEADLTEKTEETKEAEETEEVKEAPFYSSCTIGSTTIVVSAETGIIPAGTALKVVPLSENEEKAVKNTISAAVETEDTKVLNTASYDISLWNNGVEIQPNGTVKVAFEKVKRENDAAVFHVTDNKKSVSDMGAVSDGDGNQVISTTHFSIYTDAELLNYDFVKTDTSAAVQNMAVDKDITGVYKYNPDNTTVAINEKLDIPRLEEGQVWKGKEVIYNEDGTFTITLYIKGSNFKKTNYNDQGQATGTDSVYPVDGEIKLTDTIGNGFKIESSEYGDQQVTEQDGKVVWTIPENTLPTDGNHTSITYTIKLKDGAVKATTYETNKLEANMTPNEYNTYYYTHEIVTENVPVIISWNNGMGGEKGINSITLWSVLYAHTGKTGTMTFEGRECTYANIKSNGFDSASTMLWYTEVSELGGYNKYYHIIILNENEEVLYRLDGKNALNVENPGGNGDSYYFTVTSVSEDAVPVPGHDAEAIDVQEVEQIQLNSPGAANLQTDKTATVVNWDERTYDIDLYAWHDYLVEQSVSVMIALDVSGSMPWFVTQPTGGITSLDEIDNRYNRNAYNLNTGGDTGVGAWSNYKYYVIRPGEGSSQEYKPIGWDSDTRSWRFIKSKSDGSKIFETGSGNDGEVTSREQIYIRGRDDQTKLEALEEAITHFVTKLQKTAGSKVGIVTFAGVVKKTYPLQDAKSFDVSNVFNSIQLSGGTNQYAGLNKAYEELKNDDSDNTKYLILFSDGDASASGSNLSKDQIINGATNTADKVGSDKDVEALFTAGIFQDKNSDGAKNLKDWAKPDSSYAKIASSANELVSAFDSIFGMINISMEGATIKDYIDDRFELVDSAGNPLEVGATVDGGAVGHDANGWYVEWTDQTISYADNKEDAWHRTIRVKAKAEYIGGNDVTTNGPGSGVSVKVDEDTVNKSFENPTVNVKVDFKVGEDEVTIFLGDKLESYFTEEIQKAITDLQSTTGSDYTMLQDVDISIQWYTDENCTQMTTVDNIENAAPTDNTVYYAKVTVKPKTDGSSSAGNMINPDGGYYRVDPDGVSKVGTYTVHVISGKIEIVKKLEKPVDKDTTFKFVITKDGSEFKTISIIVESGHTSGKMSPELVQELSRLPRGSYQISEIKTDGYSVKEVAASEETNCKTEISDKTITFTLGTYTESGTDIDTIQTEQYDKGIYGKAEFTNQAVLAENWGIRKRSGENPEYYLGDAYFYLSKIENGTPSTTPGYVGVSSNDDAEKGIVSWYEYDASEANYKGDNVPDNKLPAGTYQLTEYKSPTGYIKSNENWTFEVNSDGGLVSITSTAGTIDQGNDGEVVYFYFDNEVVFELPESGGPGIYWYTIGGMLLMMAGSLILYKNKRREVLERK